MSGPQTSASAPPSPGLPRPQLWSRPGERNQQHHCILGEPRASSDLQSLRGHAAGRVARTAGCLCGSHPTSPPSCHPAPCLMPKGGGSDKTGTRCGPSHRIPIAFLTPLCTSRWWNFCLGDLRVSKQPLTVAKRGQGPGFPDVFVAQWFLNGGDGGHMSMPWSG